jgi:hypothetical protein
MRKRIVKLWPYVTALLVLLAIVVVFLASDDSDEPRLTATPVLPDSPLSILADTPRPTMTPEPDPTNTLTPTPEPDCTYCEEATGTLVLCCNTEDPLRLMLDFEVRHNDGTVLESTTIETDTFITLSLSIPVTPSVDYIDLVIDVGDVLNEQGSLWMRARLAQWPYDDVNLLARVVGQDGLVLIPASDGFIAIVYKANIPYIQIRIIR